MWDILKVLPRRTSFDDECPRTIPFVDGKESELGKALFWHVLVSVFHPSESDLIMP
jgi:hypothetical protein